MVARIHPLGQAFLDAKDAAFAADAAYEEAIKKQFGKNANRWGARRADYNAATIAARRAKIAAVEAMHKALEAMRAAGADIHPVEGGAA